MQQLKKQKQIRTISVKGINFPYIEPSSITTIINGVPHVQEQEPPYIPLLRKYEENGSHNAAAAAIESMRKEILINLILEMGVSALVYEAPIAVSAECPADTLIIDTGADRIIMNEATGAWRYIDADGDRAVVVFNEDRTMGVLVKYPITMQPQSFNLVWMKSRDLKESFKPLTKEGLDKYLAEAEKLAKDTGKPGLLEPMRMETPQEVFDLFAKGEQIVPVGLLTSGHNAMELAECQKMSFQDKMEYIFNSRIQEDGKPLRAHEIEDGGMKASRKDGVVQNIEPEALRFGRQQTLDYPYAWGLTSASSIGTMNAKQTEFVTNADLPTLVGDILNLKVGFRTVRAQPSAPKKETYVEGGLVTKLMRLGRLRYTEIPHENPKMPPCVVIYLTLPNGKICGLTDVKREGAREEGLTYAFIVPPIFDCRTIYDEHGDPAEGCEATYEWVHPINHLAKCLSSFDSTVKATYDGPVLWYWPSNEADFLKRGVKITNLQKALTEWCGKYGDPCPSHTDENGIPVPSAIAEGIMKRTVVVDYGTATTPEEKWPLAQKALKSCNFSLVGSKGNNVLIRKYMLANEFGGSWADSQGKAHLARPGKIRAQALRAVSRKQYRVAIVLSETQNGVLITPSGIEKQLTTEAFLPQVYNTEAEYQEYLDAMGVSPEDHPVVVTDITTWTKEVRRVWVTSPRSCIRVGKLVDMLGSKFMPRPYEQAYFLGEGDEPEEIDLIIPLEELIAKFNHLAFLKGKGTVEEGIITVGDQTFKALVLTRTFLRTGAASENIRGRFRRARFKSMDSFPIAHAIGKIMDAPKREVDFTFALQMQDALRAFIAHLRA